MWSRCTLGYISWAFCVLVCFPSSPVCFFVLCFFEVWPYSGYAGRGESWRFGNAIKGGIEEAWLDPGGGGGLGKGGGVSWKWRSTFMTAGWLAFSFGLRWGRHWAVSQSTKKCIRFQKYIFLSTYIYIYRLLYIYASAHEACECMNSTLCAIQYDAVQ